jgi:hypothetical protein
LGKFEDASESLPQTPARLALQSMADGDHASSGQLEPAPSPSGTQELAAAWAAWPNEAQEDPLEIEDYTCASPWEKFVAAVEGHARKWLSAETKRWGHQANSAEIECTYEGQRYQLTLIHAWLRGIPPPNEVFDDADNPSGKGQGPWGVSEAVRICAYFGAAEYLLVRPFSPNTTAMHPAFASWLLSGLTIALGSCESHLLAFVPTGHLRDAIYIGASATCGAIKRCAVALSQRLEVEKARDRTNSTHLPFLLELFNRRRSYATPDSATVMEAAARFIFNATGGRAGRGKGEAGWFDMATRQQFTLVTKWHGLPVPADQQHLLSALLDPWTAPVWVRRRMGL